MTIPRLSSPSLPEGQADGYFVNADGSVDIYTRHATLFGLLRDTQAPSKATLTARAAGKKLRLTVHEPPCLARRRGAQFHEAPPRTVVEQPFDQFHRADQLLLRRLRQPGQHRAVPWPLQRDRLAGGVPGRHRPEYAERDPHP